MSLLDEFNARIPLQRRIELSNATDAEDAAVPDTAKIGKAIDDVTGDFVTYAGVTFDFTNKEHIAHGVIGVVIYLEAYKGDSVKAWDNVDDWRAKLDNHLRLTQGNNRIVPKSSSKLTPVDENPSGTDIPPPFDINNEFEPYIPDSNNSGERRLFD